MKTIEVDDNFPEWFLKEVDNVGKQVEHTFGTSGYLIGIVWADDDIYYIIDEDNDGKTVWCSAVGGITVID